MMQLRGREIRTTDVEPSENQETGEKRNYVVLKTGQQIYLACNNPMIPSDEKKIHCNWKELPRHVRANDLIYIDDGKIILLATDTDKVICKFKI